MSYMLVDCDYCPKLLYWVWDIRTILFRCMCYVYVLRLIVRQDYYSNKSIVFTSILMHLSPTHAIVINDTKFRTFPYWEPLPLLDHKISFYSYFCFFLYHNILFLFFNYRTIKQILLLLLFIIKNSIYFSFKRGFDSFVSSFQSP
jgi:hypothetical protein